MSIFDNLNRKSRTLSGPTLGYLSTINKEDGHGFVPYPPGTGSSDIDGEQITLSEGHGGFQRLRNAKNLNDVGGAFSTRRVMVDCKPASGEFVGFIPPYWTLKSVATICANYQAPFGKPVYPDFIDSSENDLKGYGSTAISRCEPTNQVANASTAIGELMKDKVPNLPVIGSLRSRASAFFKLGDEFLNTAFGWLPLVNDVRQLATGVLELDKILTQYERDSGKVVRRSYYFPVEEKIVSMDTVPGVALVGNGNFGYGGFYDGQLGEITRVEKTRVERWFSGAFTYYLPYDYESRKKVAKRTGEAQDILGATLDPEVLWNLAPWSWAVDWFTNAGDIFHNVAAFADNGLILRYGYMMEHTVHTITYYHRGPSGLTSGPDGWVPHISFVAETKKRIPAGPYGFDLTWDGLSAFQLGVLGALGITQKH